MNRKYLPLILMLSAGAITSVILCIRRYPLINLLIALLVVFVIFYILGSMIKWLLDFFDKQNAKAALDAGEVIEKEKDNSTEGNGEKEPAKE